MELKIVTPVKRLIAFLLVGVLCAGPLSAATFFIADNGSDLNDGLSSETPWHSLAKINGLSQSATNNSTFLFRRGDIFRGEIRLAGSTVNATIGAYGTGENPVISGSVQITGWQRYKGDIYVANVADQLPVDTAVQQLFVDNQRMLLARYPNVANALPDPDEGWLEVGGSNNKQSFNDPVLAAYGKAAGYWVGANLRIRSFSWLFETRQVVSSTANGSISLNEDLTQTLASYIQPGWGYYLDNVLGELDHENEWYYDSGGGKLYLYAPGGVDPNTLMVEGAVYDLGCYLFWEYHDTTIDGLTFRHQNVDGIQINQSDRVVIRNSRFENIGHNGVNMAWNSVGIRIDNNVFTDILEFGIKFISSIPAGGSIISNNTIRNTAVVAGYGGSGVARGCAIRTYGVTGLAIRNNTIENTGYVGMQLEGGGHTVENNVVRYSLLTLDDGGGLFINSADNIIRGNIVTDSWGNRGPSSGTHNGGTFDNNQMGMGIFFQPYLSGNVVEDNTFANNRSHGIYPDRATNTEIKNNVCFNNGSGAYHGSQLYLTATGSNQNNTMSDNVLVSAASDQYAMRTDGSNNIGSYDNKVICNLFEPKSIRDGATEMTLAEWKSSGAGRDADASGCPQLVDPVARILVNDDDSSRNFTLEGGIFYNTAGEVLGPVVTLAPYSSLIILQESEDFYSLSKLVSILNVLAGSEGMVREILDIDQDGVVGLSDVLELTAILVQ